MARLAAIYGPTRMPPPFHPPQWGGGEGGYVRNEDGLHRIEGGQARLLDVPFEALQVQFFADYSPIANVLPGVHSLAFDPVTPGILTTGPGGVLRSDDGGQTWSAYVLSPTVSLG